MRDKASISAPIADKDHKSRKIIVLLVSTEHTETSRQDARDDSLQVKKSSKSNAFGTDRAMKTCSPIKNKLDLKLMILNKIALLCECNF